MNFYQTKNQTNKKDVLINLDNINTITENANGTVTITFIGGDCPLVVSTSFKEFKKKLNVLSLKELRDAVNSEF